MVKHAVYHPRVMPECGHWGHNDIWIQDERSPVILYCPDCNTEIFTEEDDTLLFLTDY